MSVIVCAWQFRNIKTTKWENNIYTAQPLMMCQIYILLALGHNITIQGLHSVLPIMSLSQIEVFQVSISNWNVSFSSNFWFKITLSELFYLHNYIYCNVCNWVLIPLCHSRYQEWYIYTPETVFISMNISMNINIILV